MPMGANFGDVDNDGYPDIYLGTGSPSYASLVPNVLLRNKEGKSFVDVTASSGTGELHKGHGVAFADIDYDGDEDIITSIGGAQPGDSPRFPPVRKPRQRQRLDQFEAGGSEGKQGRDRSAHQSDSEERRCGSALRSIALWAAEGPSAHRR